MSISFTLHDDLDVAALAVEFATSGRVRIAPFLPAEIAEALAEQVRTRTDWKQVLNAGEKVYEVPRQGSSALSPEQEERLRRAVQQSASEGSFQFCYDSIRVPDEDALRDPDDPLHCFARFLSSQPVLGMLRTIVGTGAIDFADAQATAYRAGDFLSAHDDAVEGKKRHAAYTFGLSDGWRDEWGGLLLFHKATGIEPYRPQMNALTLFAVPQVHSVGMVSEAAPAPRRSVTGWLRSR